MRSVVADAKIFVSFFVEQNKAQQEAALALLRAAEEGGIAGVIPQSVVFEIAYVLQSQYGLTARQAAEVVDAVTSFPACRSSMTARGNACWSFGPIRCPA